MSVWSELASACDANDLNVIRLRLSDVKRLYGASSVSIVECAAADGDRIISAAATAFASRSPLSCEYAPAVRIISRRRAGLSALYERNVLCGIVAAALIGGSADALAECAKLLINLAVIDRAALAQTMTQQETPEQVIAAAISAAKSQSRDAIFSWTRLLVLLTAEQACAQAIFNAQVVRSAMSTFTSAAVDAESADAVAVCSEVVRLLTHGALQCPNVLTAFADAPTLRAFIGALIAVMSSGVAAVDAAAEERSDENNRSAQRPFRRAQTLRMIQTLRDETLAPLLALRNDITSLFVADVAVGAFADVFSSDSVCQSFVDVLHRQLIANAEARGSTAEAAILPSVTSLTSVVSALPHVRRIVKRIIFRSAADTAVSTSAAANNMVPANAPSERRLDDDELAINALLIARLTSPSPQIKSSVGEFLYQIADANANEMIRLCGFGNAVGHLRLKGLL